MGGEDQKALPDEPRCIVRNRFRFDEHIEPDYMCRCSAGLSWKMMEASQA
jgi:hypothetical protein